MVENPLLSDIDVETPGTAMSSLDVSRNPQLRSARLAVPARSVDVTIVDNRALPACLAQRVLDGITSSGRELQSGNDETGSCP